MSNPPRQQLSRAALPQKKKKSKESNPQSAVSSSMPNLRLVRIVFDDPDATDSESDDKNPGASGSRKRRFQMEILVQKPWSSTGKLASGAAGKSTRSVKGVPHSRGVRRRPWGKFSAEIRNPSTGAREWLGTFEAEEQAAMAYNKRYFELHGKNPPPVPSPPTPSVVSASVSETFDAPSPLSVLDVDPMKANGNVEMPLPITGQAQEPLQEVQVRKMQEPSHKKVQKRWPGMVQKPVPSNVKKPSALKSRKPLPTKVKEPLSTNAQMLSTFGLSSSVDEEISFAEFFSDNACQPDLGTVLAGLCDPLPGGDAGRLPLAGDDTFPEGLADPGDDFYFGLPEPPMPQDDELTEFWTGLDRETSLQLQW